jgi:hypothetical protein
MAPRQMNPSPNWTFDHIYGKIRNMPNHTVKDLRTTRGVVFKAKALETRDGRRFIALPHNNRIYEGDWGFVTNHMGKDGQWIGHYTRPLDEWFDE